jgi:type I restriction enzyme S subunit
VTEWEDVALGDVITLQRGFDLPTQDRKPGGVPIVSSSGVSGTHAEARVSAPGVVTGRYGTIGQVFYLTEDFWPLNTTLWVKDFKGNDPRFVSYLLQTLDFQVYNDKSSVPGVNRNHLHLARVRMPALSEQRAIAHILGTLDDKIELNRRMNATLEAIARALFTSWFVGFDPVRARAEGRQPAGMDAETAALFPDGFEESPLGEIPRGWRISSLLEQAELLSGGTPSTSRAEYWGGDILWASAKDVSQSGECFLIATERTITPLGVAESATRIIDSASTVVVARGATTGRHVMLGSAMAMNQTCYALRSSIHCPYTLFCQFGHLVDDLTRSAHGSVFDTITTRTFETHATILPDTRVAAAFDRSVTALFERILAHQRESATLAATRDALLPKLLSGEARVAGAEQALEAAVIR